MRLINEGDGGLLEFINANEELFIETLIDGFERFENNQFKCLVDKESLFIIARKISVFMSNHHNQELTEYIIEVGNELTNRGISIEHQIQLFFACRRAYWIFAAHVKKEAMINHDDVEINFMFDQIVLKLLNTTKEIHEMPLINTEIEPPLPIIPLTEEMAVLPIIGNINHYSVKQIQQKCLNYVKDYKIKSMVIDLSGIINIDSVVLQHLFKIIRSLKLLGCGIVLTGITSEMASIMVELNVKIQDIKIKKDLKQAIKEYMVNN